jgi:hypothetical protein
MNKLLKLTLVALLASVSAFAQTAVTQTTLTAAVTSTSARTLLVASATGIVTPSPLTGLSTQLYIDDEMLDVTAVSGTLITVRRGANGTRARTHITGSNVYAAPPGLGAFIDYPLGGSCPAGSYPATPMIDYFDAYIFQCQGGQWALQTITGQQHFPNNLFLTAAYTNATTTFSTVTGLTFAASANHSYTMSCQVVFQGSATTAGPKFQVIGPTAPTTVLLAVDGGTGAAAYADAAVTAFSASNAVLGTLGAGATNYVAHIGLSVINGVNAGTVALQAASNGAGTLTIAAGSYCIQQ